VSLNCDGCCRPHTLARVLAGTKAAIRLTSSGALLLLTGHGDVLTSHSEAHEQAAREGLFDSSRLSEGATRHDRAAALVRNERDLRTLGTGV